MDTGVWLLSVVFRHGPRGGGSQWTFGFLACFLCPWGVLCGSRKDVWSLLAKGLFWGLHAASLGPCLNEINVSCLDQLSFRAQSDKEDLPCLEH